MLCAFLHTLYVLWDPGRIAIAAIDYFHSFLHIFDLLDFTHQVKSYKLLFCAQGVYAAIREDNDR